MASEIGIRLAFQKLTNTRLNMKKKQHITETNKAQFFQTIKRAALPLSPTNQQKSDSLPVEDCSDTQIHSHTSANAALKRGGKSR